MLNMLLLNKLELLENKYQKSELHLKYIEYLKEHISNVKKAFNEFINKYELNLIQYNKLWNDVYNHDISKISKDEFEPYMNYFYVDKDKYKDDFNKAWEHHKKYNSHHWENWTQNTKDWKINCIHNVIDWMAMGYKFNDTAKEYYENNKDKIKLTKEQEEFMYEIFNKLY
jgi:hypothetical protein